MKDSKFNQKGETPMSIRTTSPTSENYVDALCDAADEIKLRAKEIVGDIDGQRSVTVTIKMEPGEIITIDVFKSFVSVYKKRKNEGFRKRDDEEEA